MCDNISGNVGSFAESIPYSRENEEKLPERVQKIGSQEGTPMGRWTEGQGAGTGRRNYTRGQGLLGNPGTSPRWHA